MHRAKEYKDDSPREQAKKKKKDKKATLSCVPKVNINPSSNKHKVRIAVSHGNPLTEKAHLESLLKFALTSYPLGTEIKIIASYELYRFNKLYDLLMQSTSADPTIQQFCIGESPITVKELEYIRKLAEGEASEIVKRSGEAWEKYHLPLFDKVWQQYCDQQKIPISPANKPSLIRWSELYKAPLFKQILHNITHLYFSDPHYKREVDESIAKRLKAVKERAARGGKIFNDKLFFACSLAFMLEECAAFAASTIHDQVHDYLYVDEIFAALRATRDRFIAQAHPTLLHWVAIEFFESSPRPAADAAPGQVHQRSYASSHSTTRLHDAAAQADNGTRELNSKQLAKKQAIMAILTDKLGPIHADILTTTKDLPVDEAADVIAQAFNEYGTMMGDQRSLTELFPCATFSSPESAQSENRSIIVRVASSESQALTPDLVDEKDKPTLPKRQSDDPVIKSNHKKDKQKAGSQIAQPQNGSAIGSLPPVRKKSSDGRSSPGLIMSLIGAVQRKISPDKTSKSSDKSLKPRRASSTPEEEFSSRYEAIVGTRSDSVVGYFPSPSPANIDTSTPAPPPESERYPGLVAPKPVNSANAVSVMQTHTVSSSQPALAENRNSLFAPGATTIPMRMATGERHGPAPAHLPAALSSSASPATALKQSGVNTAVSFS